MESQYPSPHQLPGRNAARPSKAEYEVSHHQNIGQAQVWITTVGLYPTLQLAELAAHNTLKSVLERYMAKGWTGYYCNRIDLEYRGLITGCVDNQQYESLSEVQINVREKLNKSFSAQLEGLGELWMQASGQDLMSANVGHDSSSYNHNHTPIATVRSPLSQAHSNSLQPHEHIDSYDLQPFLTHRATESFSRTRPLYPNRPESVIPYPSAQYGQTMNFSTPHSPASTREALASAELSPVEMGPSWYGKPKRTRRFRRRGGVDQSQVTSSEGATTSAYPT